MLRPALVLILSGLLPQTADATQDPTRLSVVGTVQKPASALSAMVHVVAAVGALQVSDVDLSIRAIGAVVRPDEDSVVDVTIELTAHSSTAQRAMEWFDELEREFAAKLWRRFDGRPLAYQTIKEDVFLNRELFRRLPEDPANLTRKFVVDLSARPSLKSKNPGPLATPEFYIRKLCSQDNINFGPVNINKRQVVHGDAQYMSFRLSPQQKERNFRLIQIFNLLFSLEHESPSTSLGTIRFESVPGGLARIDIRVLDFGQELP